MEAIQSLKPQQLAEILSRWQAKASTADPDDIRTAGLLPGLLSDLEDQGFPVEQTVLHDWEPSRRPGSAQEAVSWAISQWEELGHYLRELADEAERLGFSPQSSGVHDCAEAVCGLMQQLEAMVRASLIASASPLPKTNQEAG
jgi:hypothetical protein